jgi:hypothetical protein
MGLHSVGIHSSWTRQACSAMMASELDKTWAGGRILGESSIRERGGGGGQGKGVFLTNSREADGQGHEEREREKMRVPLDSECGAENTIRACTTVCLLWLYFPRPPYPVIIDGHAV